MTNQITGVKNKEYGSHDVDASHEAKVRKVRSDVIHDYSLHDIKLRSPLPHPETETIVTYFKGEEYNGRSGRHAPKLNQEKEEFIRGNYLDHAIQHGDVPLKKLWKSFCKRYQLVMFDRFEYLVDKITNGLDNKIEPGTTSMVDMKEQLS